MHPDPTPLPPDNDTPERLKADIAAGSPEAIEAELHRLAVEYLTASIRIARMVRGLDDPWEAKRILVEALAGAIETKKRIEKEVVVRKAPKSTIEAFRR